MTAQAGAAIALQTRNGLVHGTTRHASTHLLVIELEHPLEVGETMTWRMDLVGWGDSVMGELTVAKQRQRSSNELYEVQGRIGGMDDAHRSVYRRWLEERSKGGTRQYDRSDASTFASNVGGNSMRGLSPAEAKAALERIKARKGKRKDEDLSSDLGLSSELPSDVVEAAQGRKSIADALKAGLRGSGRDRAQRREGLTDVQAGPTNGEALMGREVRIPSPPEPVALRMEGRDLSGRSSEGERDSRWRTPADDRSVGSSSDLRAPRRAPSVAPSAGATRVVKGDPEYHMDSGPPAMARVIYRSDASFRAEWASLRGHGLMIPDNRLQLPHLSIKVVLELPTGESIRCEGEVVAPMPTGAGVQLKLNAGQVAALRIEAQRVGATI